MVKVRLVNKKCAVMMDFIALWSKWLRCCWKRMKDIYIFYLFCTHCNEIHHHSTLFIHKPHFDHDDQEWLRISRKRIKVLSIFSTCLYTLQWHPSSVHTFYSQAPLWPWWSRMTTLFEEKNKRPIYFLSFSVHTAMDSIITVHFWFLSFFQCPSPLEQDPHQPWW